MALECEIRDPKKVKPTALRRAGLIPLALTRRDHTTVALQAPVDALRQAIKGADGHGRFEVKLGGEGTIKVVLKQQSFDWLHHKPLSATLQEVGEDDVLKLDVPVMAIGTPPSVGEGTGMLTQPTDHVKLRGKVADMPEQLEVDVSHLEIGQSVRAGEISLPPKVDLISSADATLFTVQVVKEITEADLTPDTGAPEEPEEGGGEAAAGEEESES